MFSFSRDTLYNDRFIDYHLLELTLGALSSGDNGKLPEAIRTLERGLSQKMMPLLARLGWPGSREDAI